ncbi:hypothetical protein [Wenyingzhuangia aestuarii]|uniref:hypothetical protein n=1 Tax=Wenyingzhuangia aestuarii TaxID=1647582 RepID=UPI00143BB355|nr:hypothetical protein [Wenyingzhuangia aestuarii]NJB82170.1 hypothetical protein [Wenyingzhuangia aestuarii]
MKIDRTLEILEALASGCNPHTGELIEDDHILNHREVIRALERTISELEKNKTVPLINIDKTEIEKTILLFKSVNYNPTYNRLSYFFTKHKQFHIPVLNNDELYGKYAGYYHLHDLKNYFKRYLIENGFTSYGQIKKKTNPWDTITFFNQKKFNTLSSNSVEELKKKINEIGIQKTENLSEYIIQSRIKHFRAYEKWTEKEKKILQRALKHTNDLELLSKCFQRGKGSIESCAKKLIYEQQ